MTEFTPLSSTLGGVLIGLSAVLMLVLNGRIAGISGIVGGLLGKATDDRGWRLAFAVGLLGGGFAAFGLMPEQFGTTPPASLPVLIVAGLLVGVGTRLGSGCTSGHGVCGLSRVSPRSMIATGTFMAAAAMTVFVTRHLLSGGA